MTYPGGFAVKNEYDNGFLKYIKKASDNAVIWQCNSANEYGNITQYSLSGTNITIDKTFNSNGYLTGIKASAGGSAKQWFRYSFDASTGDLTWIRDSLRNITENFGFDVFDQLKWSKVTGLDTMNMTYDDIGNITFKSDVGEYYYNPTRVHAIDSISDSQFQNRQDIEYNFFNKPVYIADEEDSLNYSYNVLDNRVKATLYGTGGLVKTTWYAGLYEKTLENSITKHYYYINSPDGPVAIAIQTGGGTPEFYYLCKDHLGSITGVMNSSGNIVEEYSYDAWGRRRNPTDWSYSNVATPTYTQHGFTGHEHLDMFNLINMGGRIYDSEIARFLSPDPIIQDPYNILSYNRYSYCLNNPLKYIDPSGYNREMLLREWDREQRDDPGTDQLYNNYVDYWGQIQDAFSNMHTYEESEKAKKQEKDKKEVKEKDGSNNKEPIIIEEIYAQLSAILGFSGPILGVSLAKLPNGDYAVYYYIGNASGADLPNIDFGWNTHYFANSSYPDWAESLEGKSISYGVSGTIYGVAIGGNAKSDNNNWKFGNDYISVSNSLNIGFNDWAGGATRNIIFQKYWFSFSPPKWLLKK